MPLPVQLVAFAARPAGSAAVALTWQTASETGSARFEVERSRDGARFGRVGEVAAAGSSAGPRTYCYTDAGAPAGHLYYRLRQVDQDGTATFSPVRSVLATPQGGLQLYPNPAPGGVTRLAGAAPGTAVRVVNALGRTALLTVTDPLGTATLAGLPTGLYIVQTDSGIARLSVE